MGHSIRSRSSKIFLFVSFVVSILVTINCFYSYRKTKKDSDKKLFISKLRRKMDVNLSKNKGWPNKFAFKNKEFAIQSTIDEPLTLFIERLVRRYRSDYTTIIVLDNKNSNIISAVGYDGRKRRFLNYLPFSGSHPSASLFKIITSADLIKKKEISKDSKFYYRGRGTTLYKYQLKDKKSRWRRRRSLEHAFAFSNNVIFGKSAIKNTTGPSIFKTANDFGFNKELMQEISLAKSRLEMPLDQYNLAEIASGFNKETTISPVHCALLSSVIANDGILKNPKMISRVNDLGTGKKVWNPKEKLRRVINNNTSKEIAEMMKKTVRQGTARGGFRRMNKFLKKNLVIGGKTGSITGGLPYGKRDWFTAFAVPKNGTLGQGISVCIMNINIDKWRVKSPYLAKEVISYYYKKVNPLLEKVQTLTMKNKNANL